MPGTELQTIITCPWVLEIKPPGCSARGQVLWTSATPPASKAVFKLDWTLLQNSWLEYKAEQFNFSSLSSQKSTAHQHPRYVEDCFCTLFSLVLCEFLEIKTVTGSTELIKNFQGGRKYIWKEDRSEQVTKDFVLSITYCKSHELKDTCSK